jgi:hypothetical protein
MFLHSHSHRELWVKDVDSPVCFLLIVHLSVDCAAQSWHHSLSFLLSLTRAIEKRQEGGASSDDTTALAQQVKCLLVEANEYDGA